MSRAGDAVGVPVGAEDVRAEVSDEVALARGGDEVEHPQPQAQRPTSRR